MRQWLLGVAAASLLSALALALCPRGRVREVTRLACGLVCALAVVSPLVKLDPASLAAGMASYRQQARILTENAEEEGKMQERTYIEEQCAAYICAKAAQSGAAIRGASVTARWDDEALVWYPWSARIEGTRQAELARAVEADLGIPPERQAWTDEG